MCGRKAAGSAAAAAVLLCSGPFVGGSWGWPPVSGPASLPDQRLKLRIPQRRKQLTGDGLLERWILRNSLLGKRGVQHNIHHQHGDQITDPDPCGDTQNAG